MRENEVNATRLCCLNYAVVTRETGQVEEVGWLVYGDYKRSIRTYSPMAVDGRLYGTPLAKHRAAALRLMGQGRPFLLPVGLALELFPDDLDWDSFYLEDGYPEVYFPAPAK
jgi:hypothetical protein